MTCMTSVGLHQEIYLFTISVRKRENKVRVKRIENESVETKSSLYVQESKVKI